MRKFSDITDTLNEAWEYLDNLSDLESDGSPNRELRLATEVEWAVEKLTERERLLEEAAEVLRLVVKRTNSPESADTVEELARDMRHAYAAARAFLAKLEARDA